MDSRNYLPKGTRLHEFEIVGVLGAGGFGVTYKARHTSQNKLVAIKEYYPTDFASRPGGLQLVAHSTASEEEYRWGLERFLGEAQTLLQFRHPHIVRVTKLMQLNNTAYIVLDLETGHPLRAWPRRLGRAPNQNELDWILAPTLNALELVHANGVLHRDISPDNVLLRDQGGPVLLDFGAARLAVGMRGAMSAIVKHGFSPPEQYANDPGKQGAWSDIYALGATLYFLIAGKPPVQSMNRIEKDTLPRLSQMGLGGYRAACLAAIDDALTVHPRARPQSVQAWRRQLFAQPVHPVAAPKPAPVVEQRSPPPPPPQPPPPPPMREPEPPPRFEARVTPAVINAETPAAMALPAISAPPTFPPTAGRAPRRSRLRLVLAWMILMVVLSVVTGLGLVAFYALA